MARQFNTSGKSMKFTDLGARILLEVLSTYFNSFFYAKNVDMAEMRTFLSGSMRVVKYFCYS
jgi:hypothetical protein